MNVDFNVQMLRAFFFLILKKRNKGEYSLTVYHLINVFETHIILFENFTLSAIHHEGYDK